MRPYTRVISSDITKEINIDQVDQETLKPTVLDISVNSPFREALRDITKASMDNYFNIDNQQTRLSEISIDDLGKDKDINNIIMNQFNHLFNNDNDSHLGDSSKD